MVPWVGLQCVIVVFPDLTHYLSESMDIEVIPLSKFLQQCTGCGVDLV